MPPQTGRCSNCFGATAVTPCSHCGWQVGQDNPPPALAVGRVLDGRYRVGRVLGHGGFLGRKSDGFPGPQTLWIRLQRAADFVLAMAAQRGVGEWRYG